MRACLAHVEDDPDPERARRAPPQAEGARSARRKVALGLSAPRDREDRGPADPRRDARATARADAAEAQRVRRGSRPARARLGMIVIDASAMAELLLQTGLGSRVEARLFQGDESFHAPHLLDVEVTQALRRLVRI